MARWPSKSRVIFMTYLLIFVGFPVLACVLHAWVNGNL